MTAWLVRKQTLLYVYAQQLQIREAALLCQREVLLLSSLKVFSKGGAEACGTACELRAVQECV